MPYETTTVSVGKSQDEIRKLLSKAKGGRIRFDDDPNGDVPVSVAEFQAYDYMVRLRLRHRPMDMQALHARARRSGKPFAQVLQDAKDQEQRRVWRVIVWHITSRLVAITEGLDTFEQSFFANIVDPQTKQTLWEFAESAVESGEFKVGGRGIAELLPGGRLALAAGVQ